MSKNTIGKTKRSTDEMIDDAIAQQNDWLENRRSYARRFLKTLNIFARPSVQKQDSVNDVISRIDNIVRNAMILRISL